MKGDEVLNVFYRPLSALQMLKKIGSSSSKTGVPAIYPGCNSNDNNQLVRCLSKSISSHILKKFDDRIANLPGVQESVIMIYIYFTIDEEGNPKNIKVVNKHEKIREEAERVVKTLPQMTPAMVDGKPAEMPIKIPIKFSVRY